MHLEFSDMRKKNTRKSTDELLKANVSCFILVT